MVAFLVGGLTVNNKNKYSKMVRPFCQDPKNNSKTKTLKGNANGFNPRTILTDQSLSAVKNNSKRFSFALQSSWVTDRKRVTSKYFEDVFSSDNEKETKDSLQDSLKDTQYDDIFTFGDPDFVDFKKSTFKEVADSTSCIKQLKRKNCMRDEFGNIAHHVKIKNPVAKKISSPELPSRHVTQRPNRLALSIRGFRVGTLTKTFTKTDRLAAQCILTVDYIKIGNGNGKGRIETSNVMACEWCTVQRLPALFLQTTPEMCRQLQAQLDMFEEDSRVWCDCQSRNEKEKYVVLIFENELTLLEQITLEEIFTEIGKRNNVSCFPVKLSFEEASNRLKTHNCAQMREITVFLSDEDDDLSVISQSSVAIPPSSDVPRYEIATLSDEDDLTELFSSPKPAVDKLVVYPPPPAKRGITVTEEDLKCLKEGKFLNDVIIDFYLRYLVCEQQGKVDVTKYHVFSSFFFKHLTQEDHQELLPATTSLSIQERRHNRVKTWTRNINLFEKDFIFVPINRKAHWYLAVICFPGKISQTSGLDLQLDERRPSVEYLCDQTPPNPMSLFYSLESSKQHSRWSQSIDDLDQGFCLLSDDDIQVVEDRSVLSRESNFSKRPCILIMDSLTCSGRSSVVQILQQYLQEEWKVKMGSEQNFEKMNGWRPLVPQQDNFTDCGIYLLQYVESFLKDPPQTFHDNMDLNSWFSLRTVKRKRGQIKALILKLHRQQLV